MPDEREVLRETLVARAKSGEDLSELLVTYGQSVNELPPALRMAPNSTTLRQLLTQISEEEHRAGRGMLSALVVSERGDEPGQGFYQLAKELGVHTGDDTQTWLRQVKFVCQAWKVP